MKQTVLPEHVPVAPDLCIHHLWLYRFGLEICKNDFSFLTAKFSNRKGENMHSIRFSMFQTRESCENQVTFHKKKKEEITLHKENQALCIFALWYFHVHSTRFLHLFSFRSFDQFLVSFDRFPEIYPDSSITFVVFLLVGFDIGYSCMMPSIVQNVFFL